MFIAPCVVFTAIVGFIYDLCACDSNNAVTYPVGNSSSPRRVGISSGCDRVIISGVGYVSERGNWLCTAAPVVL